MKCELCHTNDAETVLRRKRGGKTHELYVCRDCAAKESHPPRAARGRARTGKPPAGLSVTISGAGMAPPPPFIEALLSATADLVSHIHGESEKDPVCKTCGTSWEEVEKSGLLGCPDCWGVFVKKLGPRLQARQRKVAHKGKSPSGAAADRRFLERRLQDAIRKEDYAEAAKLRDALNALDAKDEGTGK